MTKEEWRDYKDFDMLSREMNGAFGDNVQNWRAIDNRFLLQQKQQTAQNRKATPTAE